MQHQLTRAEAIEELMTRKKGDLQEEVRCLLEEEDLPAASEERRAAMNDDLMEFWGLVNSMSDEELEDHWRNDWPGESLSIRGH